MLQLSASALTETTNWVLNNVTNASPIATVFAVTRRTTARTTMRSQPQTAGAARGGRAGHHKLAFAAPIPLPNDATSTEGPRGQIILFRCFSNLAFFGIGGRTQGPLSSESALLRKSVESSSTESDLVHVQSPAKGVGAAVDGVFPTSGLPIAPQLSIGDDIGVPQNCFCFRMLSSRVKRAQGRSLDAAEEILAASEHVSSADSRPYASMLIS